MEVCGLGLISILKRHWLRLGKSSHEIYFSWLVHEIEFQEASVGLDVTVHTLHIRLLVCHWLHSNSSTAPALRHCSLCPSLLRLFTALCSLLCTAEIMTNTLLCWAGPRWEIKHPYKLKGLTKNNPVDLCGLSVFPVHQVKAFSHLPSAPQFILCGRCFPAFHLADWVFQHTTCTARVPHTTE